MTTPRRLALTLGVVLQAVPVSAIELTRGPYLQLVTATSATVAWRTDAAAACSLAIGPSGGESRIIAGESGTKCAIAANDLTPGTAYDYLPRADGVPLGTASAFRTDSPAGAFVFAVIGDHGNNITTSQPEVRDRLLEIDPDFILSTGDMIYPAGAAEDFDPKFFVPYAQLLRSIVFWPCLGNHDVETDNGDPWRDAFYTPANNPSAVEDYYSFEWGNAHVLVIDSTQSTSPGSKQYAFIDQVSRRQHRPLENRRLPSHDLLERRSRRQCADRRQPGPALRPPKSGHRVHGPRPRLRAYPAAYGDEVVDPGEGTVYITTGGGGANVHPVDSSSFTAYSEEAFHVMRVIVNGDTLEADMVRADGVVRDRVLLAKGTSACGPSGCCTSQAECDDQQPCTLDTCRVSGLCRHQAVDLDDVRTVVAHRREAEECKGEVVPPRISLLLRRAQRLLERAARAPRAGRRARLVRMAERKLQRAGRRAERARRRGRITADCAGALAAGLAAAHFECID